MAIPCTCEHKCWDFCPKKVSGWYMLTDKVHRFGRIRRKEGDVDPRQSSKVLPRPWLHAWSAAATTNIRHYPKTNQKVKQTSLETSRVRCHRTDNFDCHLLPTQVQTLPKKLKDPFRGYSELFTSHMSVEAEPLTANCPMRVTSPRLRLNSGRRVLVSICTWYKLLWRPALTLCPVGVSDNAYRM
jgi:hypothetical protein